jgi:hypothetical protein
MHNAIRAVSCHKAGLVASAALVGGLGAVLLTPGTALAAVNTSTVIGSVTQSPQSNGTTTLTVPVTVEAGGGTTAADGTVTVSAGSQTCSISLAQIGSTADSGGSCDLAGLSAGTYRLEAAYAGSSGGFGASTTSTFVRVSGAPASSAPVFTTDSPALSAVGGASYSYNFRASGDPTPSYTLGSGAPSWLSINSYTGAVSGTVPQGITSFTYSVAASNNLSSATAGPFTVSVSRGGHGESGRLSTSLSCTSPVRAGNRGTCTLYVTNTGRGTDRDVVGEVSLPRQLQADFCGHGWGWGWSNWSCSISGNTASENLDNLAAGQTRTVTVTFTARSSSWLWGQGRESAKWVHVTGSASSDQYLWGWNGNDSYTGAWVRIVPRWY